MLLELLCKGDGIELVEGIDGDTEGVEVLLLDVQLIEGIVDGCDVVGLH